MELFIYWERENQLFCKKFKAIYGGPDNSSIYYDQDFGGYHERIDAENVGMIKDGICYLLERNDSKAISIFAEYQDQQIDKLRLEIEKLQQGKTVNKIIQFSNEGEILEEINL